MSWQKLDPPPHIAMQQEAYDKDMRAYRMRCTGMIYKEIGALFGVSQHMAHIRVWRAEHRHIGKPSPIERWLDIARIAAEVRTKAIDLCAPPLPKPKPPSRPRGRPRNPPPRPLMTTAERTVAIAASIRKANKSVSAERAKAIAASITQVNRR